MATPAAATPPAATTPASPTPAGRHDRPARPELVGPDDAHRKRRLAWAVLLKRTMGLDVLACPKCGDRMRLVAVIEHPQVAAKLLGHLHLPAQAPPRGRACYPPRELALQRSADEHDSVDAPSSFE